MENVPKSTLADPSEAELPKKHFARSANRGKDTAAVPRQEKGFWQAPEREESTRVECHSAKLVAQPDVQNLADVEQRKLNFNFAPATPSSDNLSAATPQPFKRPERSARTVRVSADSPLNTEQTETVLPSIEVDGVEPDDPLFEQPSQIVVQLEALTPNSKSNAQMPPPAPRAPRQTSVLEGGIVRRPRSNMRAVKPSPQRYSRLADADASQPTEEDIYYLLMSRSREAKHRERALEATQKKLRAQLHRLHEQSGTFQQQLTAASARSARQNAKITAYQAQIDDFKSRFTKFKTYARDLAQDYTDMGKAMKYIGTNTNELIEDRADINRNLEWLHKSSASASALLVGLRPKISAVAQEIRPLQHALRLAEVKAQMTDASLQQERLRNNRIETQMLGSQQVQERLSLSAMQEYRNVAGYLDDLCQAIIQLGATVTKKQPSEDIPGVVECLSLLQTLAEKQGTSITTLTEMKGVVGMISERQVS
jgi:peptidoglycan hydrolase CwlO-like protein